MPKRVNTGPGPTRLDVRNQGGIAPPTPSVPREPTGTTAQPRSNPRTVQDQGVAGSPVPPAAIPRSRQDEIQRPITSPSTTKPMPPPPPGMEQQGLQAGQQQPQVDPNTGQPIDPMTGLPQAQTQQEREMQARQMEDERISQPSHIEGIPVGTMEQIEKIAPPSGISPEKSKQWNEDREVQLKDFGDWPGKGDPKAPAPPIRPFGRSFNPFTGKFTGEKEPNAFSLMGIDLEKLKAQFYKTGGKG